MRRHVSPLSLLLALAACGSPQPRTEPLEVLRAHVAAFAPRAEHDAQRVQVRHLLVAFRGSGVPGVTRSREEAEARTAELWVEIQGGADFAALVREHSDDSPEGVYTMFAGAPAEPGAFARSGMVPAFGDTGWRLAVGEFGVAAYDPQASPFGWHIVQRLE
jgi:parvulin-like peptidyl-prolyl isomerase